MSQFDSRVKRTGWDLADGLRERDGAFGTEEIPVCVEAAGGTWGADGLDTSRALMLGAKR